MQSLKIVLLGNKGVGKTTFVISYTTNSIPQEYIPETMDNYPVNIMVDGRPLCLSIHDTAEVDQFRHLIHDGTDFYFLCFSIIDRNSFEAIQEKWLPEIKQFSPSTPFFLVGLKQDYRTFFDKPPDSELISEEEAQALASKIHAKQYLEVGIYSRRNLKGIFDEAAREIQTPTPPPHRSCVLL